MGERPTARSPRLVLGTLAHGFPLWPGRLTLNAEQLATHKHLIGVSGVGKSMLMESLWLALWRQGIGASFVDPHADAVESILALLTQSGALQRSAALDRLLYVEFLEDDDWVLPFNVLRQPFLRPHAIAANVLEAMHRAWPALGEGAAPQFDNLVLAGTLVLIENAQPLPALHRLLTDRSFRDALLGHMDHTREGDTVAFFRDRFDRWSATEAPQMIESTLRRLYLLTFSPLLKHALSSKANVLDFRRIIDRGQSVLFNLGRIQSHDVRRLLGCLITIGYETAALSRGPGDPRRQHHLLLDEFADYSAQSEEALSRMLSATRKFGLFTTMAHQTWSQASARLHGALQNVGVQIAMRVGRSDAEILAKTLGTVDPLAIKSEALTERSQPVFMELGSQWEQWIQTLVDLPVRHALVRVGNRKTVEIRTLTVPSPKLGTPAVEAVKAEYRRRLMRPRSEAPWRSPAPAERVRIQRAVPLRDGDENAS